jgi:hypothetical protein
MMGDAGGIGAKGYHGDDAHDGLTTAHMVGDPSSALPPRWLLLCFYDHKSKSVLTVWPLTVYDDDPLTAG